MTQHLISQKTNYNIIISFSYKLKKKGECGHVLFIFSPFPKQVSPLNFGSLINGNYYLVFLKYSTSVAKKMQAGMRNYLFYLT